MNKLFIIPLLSIILLSGCTTQYPAYTSTSSSSIPPTQTTSTSSQTSSVSTSQSSSTSSPQSVSVSIQNFTFSPKTITIHVGDTVTWTNQDAASHTVTSDSGSELNSGNLPTGQSYSHTFTQPGTYTYHCAIHVSMTATVVVQ